MTTQVVLIRPGATLYDEENRVQGVLDVPLSDRGRAEVADLADRLSGTPLTVLYSGPGESVVRTAEAVGKVLNLKARTLVELRNLDHGLWQGLQIDEIKRRNLKLFRQWQEDPRTVCPPRGETFEAAFDRIRGVLKPILRKHREEGIGLVVADPVARLISGLLRQSGPIPPPFLPAPTANVERIDIKVNGIARIETVNPSG